MKKKKRKVIALFITLVMLLNVGVYADTSVDTMGTGRDDTNITEMVEEQPGADEDLAPPADDSLAPGADDSLAPGADEDLAPGADDSLAPGADDSLAPGADDSLAPGADDSLAPGADEDLAPPADETVAPAEDVGLAPQEKEPEIEEPVTLTFDTGGVGITVYGDSGVLPKDTILSVNEIPEIDSQDYARIILDQEGIGLEQFRAFDIILSDSQGNEIQPDGRVEVSFSGLDFTSDDEEVVVYHFEDNDQGISLFNARRSSNKRSKDVTAIEIDAQYNGDGVVFDADHFSIYGVGTKAVATYEFYVGASQVDTQAVLNNEMLQEPNAPDQQDGKVLVGM